MLTSFALAFVAGLVTILNPCVLPLIPILVGSALGKARAGPLALAAGLVTSFTLFGFTVIAFGYSLGIDERLVRMLAGALLAVAGVVLLVPQAQAALSAAAAPLTNAGNQQLAKVSSDGVTGQYLVGLLLGLVWAPCVGPTLGVAIAAASQGESLASSFFIPDSSGRANMLEISGRNGLYAGPRKPGRALFRTRGRPCIMSTNAGATSRGEPNSLFRMQPTAGRPPRDSRSLK